MSRKDPLSIGIWPRGWHVLCRSSASFDKSDMVENGPIASFERIPSMIKYCVGCMQCADAEPRIPECGNIIHAPWQDGKKR